MADGKRANAEEDVKAIEGVAKDNGGKQEDSDHVIEDPYIEAIDYLEKNHIKDIFQVSPVLFGI